MELTHVNGNKKGSILLFALSTCVWCKKTKDLLDDLNVEYDFIHVDLTEGSEREDAINQLKQFNESLSFPTLVINEEVLIGFEENKMKELLK